MPLISHVVVLLATCLLATPRAAHTLPQQNATSATHPTPSAALPAATTITVLQNDTTKIPPVTKPAPQLENDTTPTEEPVISTTPNPTTVTTPPQTDIPDTTLPITTPPPTNPPTEITTTTTTTTTTPLPDTTTPAPTTTTTTTITTTPQDNTTNTPDPGHTTLPPPTPVSTDSSPSTTITTDPPPGPHPGVSVAISLFILVTVILVIGASVWWVRRRWQLERLRHQLMPVYNFDPTDDVDDWENQLLEEERSLRPEADKVQLYSGNATFEASQKPPSSSSQKE
ncbi:uncharacterized protein C3orf18 homolog [Portunus trituberculatus]|nr:uncharacterized protein C3orf18 homolog [Portunus trituberculatus]XP_045120970.1 uncharacterized protein C3orf18 homolog [Portunus trituberculatus]